MSSTPNQQNEGDPIAQEERVRCVDRCLHLASGDPYMQAVLFKVANMIRCGDRAVEPVFLEVDDNDDSPDDTLPNYL